MQSAHPGWCDPRYWRFTGIDVQHRSTPTLLTTCDHEWWFTLVRADEWTDLGHADPAAGRVGHHPLVKSTAGELDVEVVALAGHVRVACGAIEMMITGAPRYDLARFGPQRSPLGGIPVEYKGAEISRPDQRRAYSR
jgi:hypothetical protein